MQRYIISEAGASADGTQSTQVQKNGKLVAVIIQVACDAQADNAIYTVIPSLDGVRRDNHSAGANGLTRELGNVTKVINFTTSGQFHEGDTVVIPCNDPVSFGDNLYAHVLVTGAVSIYYSVIFMVE